MSDIKNGGSAFPMPAASYTEDCGDYRRETYHGPQHGMTLRDYFAALSLDGIMTLIANEKHSTWPKTGAEGIAATAYEVADAMLKARTRK